MPIKKLYQYEPFLFMGKLILPDGNGKVKGIYDPLKVAIDFFSHSNDTLFMMYGFNWIPEEPYYTMARRRCLNR